MSKSKSKSDYSIKESKIMWNKPEEKKFNQSNYEDDIIDETDNTEKEVGHEAIKQNSDFKYTPFNDLFAGLVLEH